MDKLIFTKPKRKVHTVFLHCSASDNLTHDDIEVVKKWHTLPKMPKEIKVKIKNRELPNSENFKYGNGWSDVGYHYYITKDCEIQTGRDLEKTPAAQKGHNTGSIAICCGGLNEFSENQLNLLKSFCYAINDAYNRKVKFRGHCEVDKNKTCPIFNYKKLLNLNKSGKIKKNNVLVFLLKLIEFIKKWKKND